MTVNTRSVIKFEDDEITVEILPRYGKVKVATDSSHGIKLGSADLADLIAVLQKASRDLYAPNRSTTTEGTK